MRRQIRFAWVVTMIALTAFTGCHPSQPFYLHEDGDLSHYLNAATEIEDPDLDPNRLAEVENAQAPLTISNSDKFEIWDLSLEDCMSIALQNSKVLKSVGAQSNAATQIFQPDLLRGLASGQTIYDPSILETDPQAGVETALSEFDAQFTTQAFWQNTDRPQNISQAQFPFVPLVLMQNLAQVDSGIRKKTATGTEFAFRSQTIYDYNNRGFGRAVPSDWFQALEAEAKIPLMRGRGTQINRLPIVLARLRVDVSLADFEAAVRNQVFDTEKAYWELNAVYRALETAKTGRDSALGSWRNTRLRLDAGTESTQQESQAREQYFFFRAQVETQLQNVYNTENTLRFLMGLAATDGRLIRPSDDPSTARVEFDWNEIHAEALTRSVELRRQKWTIKQRELQLIAARNQLLPQFNATLMYRWLGLGDELGLGHERNGINFPNPGSQAWENLTEGDFQESRIGFEFVPPKIGARKELSGVRNAELAMAREQAILEEMELNVSHFLTNAVRTVDTQYLLAQTHFNRLNASEKEVEAVQTLFANGKSTLDLVLDAQRRRAQAQVDYFRAVAEYNKAIALVHYRKGSLLDYCGIQLAEGPWPKKAYWDALGRARERDASTYLNYGWTRPKVMSRGAVEQIQDTDDGTRGATPAAMRSDGQPAPAPQIDEPTPAPKPGPITRGPSRSATPAFSQRPTETFDWGGLGLNPLRSGEAGSVQTVSYEEEAATNHEPEAHPSAHQADQSAPGRARAKR